MRPNLVHKNGTNNINNKNDDDELNFKMDICTYIRYESGPAPLGVDRPPKRRRVQLTRVEEHIEDLSTLRRRNEQKLKSRFLAICAKYGRDFGDSSDVIDLFSGDILEDHGHLRQMRHERDVGVRRPRAPAIRDARGRARFGEYGDDDPDAAEDEDDGDDDELAFPRESEPLAGSLWDPVEPDEVEEDEDEEYSSQTLATRVIESAVALGRRSTGTTNGPVFIKSFGRHLMEQVTQIMQTLENPPARVGSITVSRSMRKSIQSTSREIASTFSSLFPQPQPQAPLSTFSNTDFSEAASLAAFDQFRHPTGEFHQYASRENRFPFFARRPNYRPVRWSTIEDEKLVRLARSGTIHIKDLAEYFPDRTPKAIRQRRILLRRRWQDLQRAGNHPPDSFMSSTPAIGPVAEQLAALSSPAGSVLDGGRTDDETDIVTASDKWRPEEPLVNGNPNHLQWTEEDDRHLIQLVKINGSKFKSIAPRFPERTPGSLTTRFYKLLNPKNKLYELALEAKTWGRHRKQALEAREQTPRGENELSGDNQETQLPAKDQSHIIHPELRAPLGKVRDSYSPSTTEDDMEQLGSGESSSNEEASLLPEVCEDQQNLRWPDSIAPVPQRRNPHALPQNTSQRVHDISSEVERNAQHDSNAQVTKQTPGRSTVASADPADELSCGLPNPYSPIISTSPSTCTSSKSLRKSISENTSSSGNQYNRHRVQSTGSRFTDRHPVASSPPSMPSSKKRTTPAFPKVSLLTPGPSSLKRPLEQVKNSLLSQRRQSVKHTSPASSFRSSPVTSVRRRRIEEIESDDELGH